MEDGVCPQRLNPCPSRHRHCYFPRHWQRIFSIVYATQNYLRKEYFFVVYKEKVVVLAICRPGQVTHVPGQSLTFGSSKRKAITTAFLSFVALTFIFGWTSYQIKFIALIILLGVKDVGRPRTFFTETNTLQCLFCFREYSCIARRQCRYAKSLQSQRHHLLSLLHYL